ncbi:MAG: hypothetical protein ACPHE1_06220, partial [Pseudomonadales bacterium]
RGNRKTEWTDCFLFALILHAAFLDGFFLPAFFLRAFYSLTFYCELFWLTRLLSSLWSLYLRIVLDGRYGRAVIVCTGSLLRLLITFLVLYCRSLTAFSQLRAFFVPHRLTGFEEWSKGPTGQEMDAPLAHWARHEDCMNAGIRHESSPARYHAECCPTGDP